LLNEIRLSYYVDHTFLHSKDFRDVVDWFLVIELRRAEHVYDAYRRSMNLNLAPSICSQQRIYRFYHKCLENCARFSEFNSEFGLELPRPLRQKHMTVGDLLDMPLIINSTPYAPL
jgi:hypothetical protein